VDDRRDADSIWVACADVIWPETAFAAAPQEVAAVLRLTSLARARLDVLDIPCGPGRHAAAFAALGHRVVAVDFAEAVLARVPEHPGITRRLADMRTFVDPARFDLAVNLNHSFGYFAARSDDLRVLRNLRMSLRTGGALVLALQPKECLLRNHQEVRAVEMPGGVTVTDTRSLGDHDWMHSVWTVRGSGREHTFDMSFRMYGAQELVRELFAAGFRRAVALGGYDGRPFDADATRLVAIGFV
jgi:SAM-dependent methyltransferase